MVNQNELCDCGKMAVWCYMPGFSSGERPYLCDDCVNRGCECNNHYVNEEYYSPALEKPNLPDKEDGEEGKDWKWLDPGNVWCHVDEQGREYPCCEYMYSEEGFEIE